MKYRCLYCYKVLDEEQTNFHPACSKKIFGTPIAPKLHYTKDKNQPQQFIIVGSPVTLICI